MSAHAPVVILYEALPQDATPSEQDTLVQVDEVALGLETLGYTPVRLPVTLDLLALKDALIQFRPRVVFNLVESLGRSDALMPLAPMVIEAAGFPCTGASSAVLATTGDKVRAKGILRRARIPTPETWPVADTPAGLLKNRPESKWIIKSLTQQASFGLDDVSVVTGDRVAEGLKARRQRYGGAWFAERFIPGREFNYSVLQVGGRVKVLPPAEIRFVDFPEGKPHIVGYEAKWNPDAPEYHNTPRRFDFGREDRDLLHRLKRLALRAWKAFDLNGYARVDFRVDPDGNPWVLEINANPCLARDAGFVAAAMQAGINYEALIQTILETGEGSGAPSPTTSAFFPAFSRKERASFSALRPLN